MQSCFFLEIFIEQKGVLLMNYAKYYDAMYQEKDYAAECNFLEKIFKTYASSPIRRILDVGCGTGGHALPLAKRDYFTTGVDASAAMVDVARQKSR